MVESTSLRRRMSPGHTRRAAACSASMPNVWSMGHNCCDHSLDTGVSSASALPIQVNADEGAVARSRLAQDGGAVHVGPSNRRPCVHPEVSRHLVCEGVGRVEEWCYGGHEDLGFGPFEAVDEPAAGYVLLPRTCARGSTGLNLRPIASRSASGWSFRRRRTGGRSPRICAALRLQVEPRARHEVRSQTAYASEFVELFIGERPDEQR